MILYQRIPTPRSPPTIVLKEPWQVQRVDQSQRRSSIGKPIADEGKFKIDPRVQGVPQSHTKQMKIEQGECETWRTFFKINAERMGCLQVCKRLKRATHLAKSPRKSSTTWVRSSSCAKYWPEGGLALHWRTLLIAVRKAKTNDERKV